MDEVVGRALIEVDVDGGLAQAAFAKLRADAERAMADIDRMEGNAKIDADRRPLEREIAAARREVLSLEKEKAEIEVGADTSELDRKLGAAKLKVKELNQQKIELKVNTDEIRDANKQLEITQKREAAAEGAALKRARAQQQASLQRDRAIKNEQQALQRLGREQTRAIAEDARRSAERTRMQRRSLEMGRKEIDQTIANRAALAKLRQEYGKTLGTVQQIQKTTGRPGGIFRTASEARDLDVSRAKLASLEHEIAKLGGTVKDIDPALERHQGIIGKWGSSISNVRLQLGFFSATLRQLAIGLVALGPVMTGLVGSATSVVGVLGTGLAGGLSVGSAALSGFLLTAAGIGMVLKPAISEFNEANKATEAYSKALMKYGPNSTQVKDAQEKMNHVLAKISPNAQAAAKGWANMKSRWSEMTAATKDDVLGGINQSIRTANALLPTFAKQTSASTKVASQAWAGWMKSLRSSEAKRLLGDVMENFRDSIPGISGGLASIGAAFGRISASASRLLPSLTGGFAEWANNLEKSIGRGAGLDAGMDRIVRHMRDLGHLAQSSGSLLTNLFNTGADSGDDLVKSLTKVTDRWNAWVKSAHGQESLDSFFGEARGETEKLAGVLSRMTNILFQVGRATAPLSNGFLTFATAVGDVVQTLTQFAPLRATLTGLGATLGAIWVAGKVKAFAGAIKDAGSALKGLAVANGLLSTSEAVGSGGFLSRLFGRGGGRAAAAEVGAVGSQLSMFGARAGAATGAAGLLAAALSPQVLIPVGLIAGLALLIGKTEEVETAWEQARKEFNQAADAIPKAISVINKSSAEYTSAQQKQVSATDAVAAARHRLIKVQNEGAPVSKQTQATVELANAERQQAAAVQRVGEQNRGVIRNNKALLDGAEQRVNAAKAQVRALQDEHQARIRATMGPGTSRAEAIQKIKESDYAGIERERRRFADAERDLSHAQREVVAAQIAQAASAVPVERSYKNLAPLTQQTQQSLEKLSKTIGAQGTKKIGSFVDPKDVQRVTNLGNQLTKLGRGGQVKQIAVKSQGADQTLNKLQQLQRQSARVDGKVTRLNVKTDDRGAQQKLTNLARLSQRVTGSKNTIRILANSSNAEQAINRLRGHLRDVAQKKYQAKIDAIDKTGGPVTGARAKLLATAQKRYQARLEAIDNVTSVAGKAKGAGDKVARGRYQAKITANAGQAMSAIGSVSSALSAIDGRVATTTIRTVHETVNKGGRYAGGPAHYAAAPFAIGGPSDKLLERAAEKAVMVPAGPSRKVNKPTMLTGEEAPRYPEYVIATNPSYRDSNERYLGSAARDLGYELIPAYKKGKGSTKKSAGKSSTDGDKKSYPGKKPPPISKRTHRYLKMTKLNDHGLVKEQHGLEKGIERAEESYETELGHEEREIAAGRMQNWNYGMLKGFKQTIITSEKQLENRVFPRLSKKLLKQQEKAEDALGGTRRQLSQVGGTIGTLENEYDKMEKSKNESTKDFNTKKRAKKRQINDWKKTQAELKKAKEHEEEIIKEAKKEISEIKSTFLPEAHNAGRVAEDDAQYITDVETGAVDQPYENSVEKEEAKKKEEEAAAKSAAPPTIGEQTATLNNERQNLYSQFASNIAGKGPAAPGTAGLGTGGVAQGGPHAAAAMALMGAGNPLGYAREAMGRRNNARGGAGLYQGEGGSGTVNKVTNNFAAPPPDPHTWTRQQQFELGALS